MGPVWSPETARSPRMHFLLLQFKRIGDLVLTAPALAALRAQFPAARITLATTETCAPLAPLFPHLDTTLVLPRSGPGLAFWKMLLTLRPDACLDFTGTDRSALASWISRAPQRLAFSAPPRFRTRAYTRLVESPVRERHTVDHHLQLLTGLHPAAAPHEPNAPHLLLPPTESAAVHSLLGPDPFVVLHPGTARPEKFWAPDHWAALAREIQNQFRIRVVLTGGSDPFEQDHLQRIHAASPGSCVDLSGKIPLSTFAAVLASARLVVSTDTAALHLASAFRVPQIALFGPTNPFHWRPRHPQAMVFSAAHPDTPMSAFEPRMKGAPMDGIQVGPVARCAAELLEVSLRP